ncbi:hypothetical protein TSOC_013372 [Tetrabaena socialis]|uniref:SAP domain-containing protein n=1 Tax=Tetrabaena socialis TaxID=47790 RepID=A0A2J7ZKJ0_9CHLO|nr:hypothetical protein TSOC_013372 [Tetrabaena socialis]|eukprot:PNH00784.1 hypothetical protein TSOC_013372 [Tetrabaena socialis]
MARDMVSVLLSTPEGLEGDDVDDISEDLRDMLTRIEEEDVQVPVDVQAGVPVPVVPVPAADEDIIIRSRSSSPGPLLESDLRTMKVDDLKKLLRDRNLDVTGKKDALIARLI